MKPIAAIIVPYFNELQRFNATYFDSIESHDNIQIYFVDDGSTDGTEEILMSRYQNSPNVKMIGYDKNLGKAHAVKYGFTQVLKQSKDCKLIIGFIDFDSSIDPKELIVIIRNFQVQVEIGAANSVWAVRKKKKENRVVRKLSRHIIGRIIHQILKLKIRDIPCDTQCGLKLFDRKSADIFTKIQFQTRWLFEIEFLKYINSNSIPLVITEYELNYWREISGSKVTTIKNIKNILDDLRAIFKT